jgi:hypothetical protein
LAAKLDDIRQILIKKALEALDFLQEQLTEEEGCERHDDADCTAIILGTFDPRKASTRTLQSTSCCSL